MPVAIKFGSKSDGFHCVNGWPENAAECAKLWYIKCNSCVRKIHIAYTFCSYKQVLQEAQLMLTNLCDTQEVSEGHQT